ncbi:MAG: N-acetylmuramoyl-L-alanine amidase [Lachnospiraceae bacterium]|nr:N-acetylmuramoyl-L-alanine amidase [Lachnospiraceae bacterium]
MTKEKRKTDKRKQRLGIVLFAVCCVVVGLALVLSLRHFYLQLKQTTDEGEEEEEMIAVPPLSGVAEMFPELPIREEFLTVNRFSRPGLSLTTNPQYIVIHYTANPGSTAEQNRNYFENLKDTGETFASAQFVIGLEGEIIQCVPCNEMAYCSNQLNEICISIELCHPDETGNFKDATYNNCVYLVAKLMNYYHMDMDHLIRHYDVTGKNCPKYFVEHEDRWEVFKGFVEEYREKYTAQEE